MDVLESRQYDPLRSFPWPVRGVMWLVVALCLALLCAIAVAPFFPHAASPVSPGSAWAALEAAGVACGACVFGAGFLATLAWRNHAAINGLRWAGDRPVAPRLPWYTRAWAGIVCAGALMILLAQLHRAAVGDGSWPSIAFAVLLAAMMFRYLGTALVTGRWGRATVLLMPLLSLTPRQIRAAARAEHADRRGT